MSVWPADLSDLPPEPSPWLQPWAALQRLARGRQATPPAQAAATPAHDPTHNAAHKPARRPDILSLPETSRGQALRLAHRALRDRLRLQRALRRVLPHLYFTERALARQGSAALHEVPIWVLQRALLQLSRLPADSLAEREQFNVLQQRLVEAIGMRSEQAAEPWRRTELADSFLGGLDSQIDPRNASQTAPGSLDMPNLRDAPPSAFDDPDVADGGLLDGGGIVVDGPDWHRGV